MLKSLKLLFRWTFIFLWCFKNPYASFQTKILHCHLLILPLCLWLLFVVHLSILFNYLLEKVLGILLWGYVLHHLIFGHLSHLFSFQVILVALLVYVVFGVFFLELPLFLELLEKLLGLCFSGVVDCFSSLLTEDL